MSKLVSNYTSNGSSTTDEYGTFIALNRLLTGDVIEGFAVTQNTSLGMSTLVQPGSGRITTGTYPSSYGYFISHDTTAGEVVTHSTAAASPRIDYVIAYIDKFVAGSTSSSFVNNTNNVLKFAAVAGTPSGSPVVPTTSQIQTAIGAANPYIILAQIAVGANVTQITNSNITDLRNFAYAGSVWKTWTPTTTNFNPSLATTNYARYRLNGKAVEFRVSYTFTGAAITGTEPAFTLPVTAASYQVYSPIGFSLLNHTGVSTAYGPTLLMNTTQVTPYAWNASSTYLSYTTASATVPHTWSSGDVMAFSGRYEAA